MMKHINILNSKERKLLLKDLTEFFGVKTLPDLVYFYFEKKEKLYCINREVFDVEQDKLRINMMGLQLGTYMKDGFRLSLEGINIFKDQLNKNIVQLSSQDFENWLKGEDLDVENKEEGNTYVLLKHNNDFVGCGKLTGKRILNYLPKSRKLKKVLE